MLRRPILYGMDFSPPVRTVLLTAKYLGLDLENRKIDIFKQEQLSKDYLKINPQNTIPTLDDNGVHLWESAAICVYLITKYGPPDGCSLYPVDPVKRARIDQRLYFNAAILFPPLRRCMISAIHFKRPVLAPSLLQTITENYAQLETFLGAQPAGVFLVGDEFTLADLVTAVTVSTSEQIVPLSTVDGRHAGIAAWQKRVAAALPFFGAMNTDVARTFGQQFAAILQRNGQKQDVTKSRL